MKTPEIIGYIGCVLLSITFIPQTCKLIAYNKYDSVSYSFLFLIILTSSIMTTYGFMINAYPVCIVNISVLLNNYIILCLKANHNYKKKTNVIDIEKNTYDI